MLVKVDDAWGTELARDATGCVAGGTPLRPPAAGLELFLSWNELQSHRRGAVKIGSVH